MASALDCLNQSVSLIPWWGYAMMAHLVNRGRPLAIKGAALMSNSRSSRWMWLYSARLPLSRRVAGLALLTMNFLALPSVVLAEEEEPVDQGWHLTGGVSLLPGSDGGSRVGYGLTLSRSLSKRTAFGLELTSSFGGDSGDVGSTRIHTVVGGFVSQSLYGAQGISVSAGLSAGAAFARTRVRDGDLEIESTETFPYVEPKLSASLSLPGGGSGFSGSIGWMFLPGEDFSEPRFSFGFAF